MIMRDTQPHVPKAMVSHTVRGLQVIMDALQDTSEKYNMRINTKKTKIMKMSTVERRTMKITVNGQNLERVKQFCSIHQSIFVYLVTSEVW